MPEGTPNYPIRQKYSTFPSGDPRRRLLRTTQSGAPVSSLPTVITLGVNGVSATAANVVGTVNPNGLDTSWWVAYGVTLPLSPGTTTTPVDIGSGTTGTTVTYQLTGLVANIVYYVALVGQSAAGTVYGATVAFIAQSAPVATTPPPAPTGQPFVSIPHFNVPFAVTVSATQSGAVVVDQDTSEEVLANVRTISLCAIGQCAQIPSFGRPDPLFQQAPLDTTEMVAAIQLWEPRASAAAVSQVRSDGTTWGLDVTTSYSGDQG